MKMQNQNSETGSQGGGWVVTVTPTQAGQWRWGVVDPGGVEVAGGGGYETDDDARADGESELAAWGQPLAPVAEGAKHERAGVDALGRLVPIAQGHTGQSGTVARFLLGLYNGRAFPFDLTGLRGLDGDLHDDCMAVLLMDRRPRREVHRYIEDGGAVFADLAARWGDQ
jgi:hypothetical protein